MKKHDENRDLRSVARIAKILPGDKSIKCSKNATIGIHMWGRIDFLVHYCGWHLIWDNSAGVTSQFEATEVKKKPKKEHKLTDKTKKTSKKK